MRPVLCIAAAVLITSPVSAKIYKCTSASGESTYQQIPCAGVSEVIETDTAPPPVSGYNEMCTHFNGHEVLNVSDIDRLDDAKQEEYLKWLFSDEAPSKAQKEECFAKQELAEPVTAEAIQEKAEPVEVAAEQKVFSETAALDSYSFVRVIQRQISACKGIAPAIANDAQSALNEYKTDSRDLRQHGRALAKTGTTVAGEQLSAADIDNGIREKEQEVLTYFGKASSENSDEMIEKCEQSIAMIDQKYSQLP